MEGKTMKLRAQRRRFLRKLSTLDAIHHIIWKRFYSDATPVAATLVDQQGTDVTDEVNQEFNIQAKMDPKGKVAVIGISPKGRFFPKYPIEESKDTPGEFRIRITQVQTKEQLDAAQARSEAIFKSFETQLPLDAA
jgi:hypothetical protein